MISDISTFFVSFYAQLHRFRKEPRLYWTVTKYYKHAHDGMPKIHRLNECSTSIKEAHAEFKRFFLKKTGVRWEERLMGRKSEIPDPFHYAPPVSSMFFCSVILCV